MPSVASIAKLALILGSVAQVAAHPKFLRPRTIEIRQAPAAPPAAPAPGAPAPAAPPAAGAAPALTDTDILQFALTLENLESTFYMQGFQKFPDSDFMALGLTQDQVGALKIVGQTEATHVTTLTSAISAAGAQPVQACQYNFGFTTAANMVATARVLEAVGISAYLGAAPLVKMPAVLTAAAEIVTVEARHQTFIRTASKALPVPNAFDSPLGPRAVFTLASQFIQSCPQGSNLNIQAFPAIALAGGGTGIAAGQSLVLADPNQPTGAQFCAFVNQGQSMFAQLTSGSCTVPQNMSGEVYMMVTRSASIADTEILAGPSVIIMS
ncbi:hypothetical protein BT63DRAFT_305758 [Microthyrium microscopicum]|uniref:Twin-arginine translocation pathway signal n=1 Tax=Microthyrium microscopicum TaxID=703497 RepID=A0A6A6UAM2_9PEZI|nr:hypothetical protein BT63DRAFT_305758 [Microthyrium microscopicum]